VIGRAACIVGIAAVAGLVWFCDRETAPERVQFAAYDEKPLAEAKKSGKPVVVYTTASWDRKCQEQNRGALMDPKVMAALEPFTRLKNDVTKKHPSELALIDVGELPNFTFRDKKGEVVSRLFGTQTAEQLIEAAKKAATE
jgi:thiol:disulfide interchange protein